MKNEALWALDFCEERAARAQQRLVLRTGGRCENRELEHQSSTETTEISDGGKNRPRKTAVRAPDKNSRWERPALSGSTVGSCWDRPSAFAGIDRRLLLGSTVGFYWDRPQAAR
jgi:hypothetical protein